MLALCFVGALAVARDLGVAGVPFVMLLGRPCLLVSISAHTPAAQTFLLFLAILAVAGDQRDQRGVAPADC